MPYMKEVFEYLDRYPVNVGTTEIRVVRAIAKRFNLTFDFAALYLAAWFELAS
jgi:hypothetical protein